MSNARDYNEKRGPAIHLTTGERGQIRSFQEIRRVVSVLGSGDGCDMVLASSRIDSAHAVIVRLGGGAFVCDLGAPGGTQVNGQHVRWSRLEDGDELTIGPFNYGIEIEHTFSAPSAGTRPFSLRNDLTIGIIHSEDPVLLIGSDAACDVVLSGSAIAPRHAIIVWTSEGPMVRDLQGRALVRLNGDSVREAILQPGDSIGVGPYEMRFEIEARTPGASMDVASATARGGVAEVGAAFGLPERSVRETPDALEAERPIPVVAGPDDEADVAEHNAARELVEEMDRIETGEAWTESDDASPSEALDDSEVLELLEEVEEVSFAQSDNRGSGHRTGSPAEQIVKAASATRSLSFSPDELVAARVMDDREAGSKGFSPDFRDRVIAAQHARARKLREELDAERQRLKACQDQLKGQAQKLLAAAQANQSGAGNKNSNQTEPAVRGKPTASRIEDDDSSVGNANESIETIERLFAGASELSGPDRNMRHTRQTAESIAEAGERAKADTMSLQAQVNELMEMVRDEQGGMRDAEGRLESLRFEIERLRSEVARAREKHQVQSAEHEARFESLQRSLQGAKQERESLMLRLRRLDAKESALNTRVTDAKRIRKDMEREANRLARLQEEHDDRLRELRINLESERHRLRLRQTELQKRAGELAKLARTRRHAIEEIVREQQSALQESEADLKAKRTAIAEAGRAELEKTATELEQLLSVRLSDVESELLARQESLDSWIRAIWDTAKSSTGESKKSETIGRASRSVLGLGEKPSTPPSESQVRHLAQLESELENLHRAVIRMEDDSDHKGGIEGFSTRGSSILRDRRLGGELTTRFAEKFSSFRIGEQSEFKSGGLKTSDSSAGKDVSTRK